MTSTHSADGKMLDPVAAYGLVAPIYARLSDQRRAYLDTVEQLIVGEIPLGKRSLLDVGSGDGARAVRIATEAGLRDVTLLEPSAAMRRRCQGPADVWAMPAEDLHRQRGSFDVITCLWNVLGHIFPAAARVEAMRQFARLLAAEGRIFIDVSHRYNARHYGALATAARFLWDRMSPGDANGDVKVVWDLDGRPCATAGHVFTHREFAGLAREAGLRIEKRFVIDYATGQLRQRSYQGNLLYVLR